MRNHFLARWAKGLLGLLCIAVCVWCAAEAFRSWAAENGREALLFAAGLAVEPAPSESPAKEEASLQDAPELFSVSVPDRGEGDLQAGSAEEKAPVIEEDGIAPFHADELPGIFTTPDPERSVGTVEEREIAGGVQVGDFFVRDATGSDTDLNAELLEDPEVHIKGDGSVEVLIYHTHTSESYSKSFTGFYYTDMETRTDNGEMNVTAVGEELKKPWRPGGSAWSTTLRSTTPPTTAPIPVPGKSFRKICRNIPGSR